MKKDYYSVLGVQRGASDADIKQAYRKLAMRYHPDRNPGDKAAEGKFKEISEAYECLSDPQKRQQYDFGGNQSHMNNGHSHTWTFTSNDGTGFTDMFSNIFGRTNFPFGNPFADGTRHHNFTQIHQISISLEDAFSGRTIRLQDGVTINIPAGVRSGTKIFHNNILYSIDVQHHHKFKRANDDLLVDIEISAIEAMLGTSATLEHIDRSSLQFDIPAGIQQGQIIKLSGKGMRNPEIDRVGDLLVRISVKIPKNIPEKYIEILKQFDYQKNINI